MADLLQNGSDWLESQRDEHLTRIVTYQRGEGGSSVNVPATIGRTVFEVDSSVGVLERIESRDYLILTADLVLDGQQTPPKQGDLIKETDNGTTYTYEVMAPGGAPHFRYSDPHRKTLRIHTKQIDPGSNPGS